MIVYLDLIFLENILMNYLILYTTGKLLNRKIIKIRLLCASIVGGLYVISLYINLPSILLNISKILICFLLIKISFNSKKFKNILKEVLTMFFITFVFGGCALGFLHLLKPKVIYIVNGIIIGGEYIFEIVIISAILSFILIKINMNIIKFKQKFSKNDLICKLKLGLGNNYIVVNSIIDSGNLLSDPISKSPIIIVEKEKLRALIPYNEIDEIDDLIGGELNKKINFNSRIRAVPYMSVGNSNGIIVTYKMDWIKLEYNGEIFDVNNALIGIYNNVLTRNNKYSGLIGLKILEGSTINNEFNKNFKNEGKYSIC